ncbi:MAG: helix-turn-helix domain-containing protein [Oligoflexia bacterium]|nr:helix-turn-helix domain-containing protein [Oligoflexia bacterium]
MKELRKITSLKNEEYLTLKDMMRYCPVSSARPRAHAVILNSKGYSIDELSDIFEVDRDTISTWLTNWEVNGLGGLYDEHKSGRPAIIDDKDTNAVKEIIINNPRSLKTMLKEIKKN